LAASTCRRSCRICPHDGARVRQAPAKNRNRAVRAGGAAAARARDLERGDLEGEAVEVVVAELDDVGDATHLRTKQRVSPRGPGGGLGSPVRRAPACWRWTPSVRGARAREPRAWSGSHELEVPRWAARSGVGTLHRKRQTRRRQPS
jgi:hypothetical protein